jgi:hypothetical protein
LFTAWGRLPSTPKVEKRKEKELELNVNKDSSGWFFQV